MPKKKKNAPITNGVKTNENPVAMPKERPLIRAIRISPQILEAAKKLKLEKGISFYRLGLEAISDRLVKEGYMKEPAAKA